jgi:acyl dehydratase
MNNPTTWDTLAPGTSIGEKIFGPITQTDIVRYQGASGDFQPIHHDPAFAARAGLQQPLMIGMLPAGLVAGWVSERFGVENIRYFRVRWIAAMWPGDQLSVHGTIANRHRDAEGNKVDIELPCTNQNGGVVLQCSATVLLP